MSHRKFLPAYAEPHPEGSGWGPTAQKLRLDKYLASRIGSNLVMSSRLPKLKPPSKKEIITFIVSLLLTIALPITVYTVKTKIIQLRSRAKAPDLLPAKVAISNIYNRGFSISWVTDGETTAKVFYGTNPDNLSQSQSDDSSTSTIWKSGVHQVTLGGLSPETEYYFKICSGSDCEKDELYGLVPGEDLGDDHLVKSGVAVPFTTPKELSMSGKAPLPVFGVALEEPKEKLPPKFPFPFPGKEEEWSEEINRLGIQPGRFLVRLKVVKNGERSSLLSFASTSTGGKVPRLPRWLIDLANARKGGLSEFFDLDKAVLEITAFSTSGKMGKVADIEIEKAQPIPDILWMDEEVYFGECWKLEDGECIRYTSSKICEVDCGESCGVYPSREKCETAAEEMEGECKEDTDCPQPDVECQVGCCRKGKCEICSLPDGTSCSNGKGACQDGECAITPPKTCNEKCVSQGFASGYCDSALIYPGATLCEPEETNMGETEDCYVPPGLLETRKACCCRPTPTEEHCPGGGRWENGKCVHNKCTPSELGPRKTVKCLTVTGDGPDECRGDKDCRLVPIKQIE